MDKSNSLLVSAVAFTVLASLATTSVRAFDGNDENLLVNGSFEKAGDPPTAPAGWVGDAFRPSATLTWDGSEGRAGARSVKIDAPIEENDARWIQEGVSVEPNTVYFLSGWIKTENVAHTTGVDAGANLSLLGYWKRSPGVFGTQDWTRQSLLFNSEDDIEVTVAARLGFWSGITTGTAWFDDLQLEQIVPMDPHPSWKILVLIYKETNFEVTVDDIYHHYVASMTTYEMVQAAEAAEQFVETDIPALTSGNMVPEITIRFPDQPLTELSPIGAGWWPAPQDTASDRDPAFDSVLVIWDPRATDLETDGSSLLSRGEKLT